ncbi:MAG: hypothetical protein K8R59_05385 [Thermoanaerobaculales bacterium]|nr:hypothetical protein [Thermoanaerobaculales bacterium]
MVFFNWATMQMAAKIVYYGPGLCGKTSNLSFIYARTSPKSRGEMVSLETESDRTLFFDLLPIEVGTVGGFKTRLQLYTVPGQVFYNTTRKLVLKGVDGLVFVADSQRPMREANIESLRSLMENIADLGMDTDDVPLVLQYNKRDLKHTLTLEELNADLNPEGQYPFHMASAINGDGVFETLKEITKITLKKLRRRMASPQDEAPTRVPRRPPEPPPKAAVSDKKPSPISAASLARAAEEGVGDAPVFAGPELAAESPVEPIAVATPPEPPIEAPLENQPPFSTTPDETDSRADHQAQEISGDIPETPSPEETTAPSMAESHAEETSEETFPTDLPGEETTSEPIDEVIEIEFVELEDQPTEIEDVPVEIEDVPVEIEDQDIEIEDVPVEIEDQDIEIEAPSDDIDDQPIDDEGRFEEGGVQSQDPTEVQVEFDTSAGTQEDEIEPPPIKRVRLSNEMDVLSELDGLRRMTTEVAGARQKDASAASDLDLDSLLTGRSSNTRDLKRRIEQRLNSNIFRRMHSLQLAFRIQNEDGETIHTLDPVSLSVEDAASFKNLILQLTIDLENVR